MYLFGTAVVAFLVYYFSDIVTYILLAWVLSMLGHPLVIFFRRHIRFRHFRLGPSGGAMLTILTFYAFLVGLMLIFVPTIVTQARNLSSVDYQALGEKIRPWFSNIDVQMHQVGMLDHGESLATKTQESLSTWFKPALVGDVLGSFVGVAGNVLVTLASVTFILFFFLQDNHLFTDIIHAVVPDEHEQKVHTVIKESNTVLTRYFRGLLIQLLAFSVAASVILWILGVPNAILLGAFGGIFNVVPYVGPILGLLFGEFITVSSQLESDFSTLLPLMLKVMGAFFTVQAIDNNIVGPMIMSKSVKAHPLEIFVVTLAAAKLGGVVGMVIGIPVYTVLRVIARIFFSEFKVVQRLTEHLD